MGAPRHLPLADLYVLRRITVPDGHEEQTVQVVRAEDEDYVLRLVMAHHPAALWRRVDRAEAESLCASGVPWQVYERPVMTVLDRWVLAMAVRHRWSRPLLAVAYKPLRYLGVGRRRLM